MEPIRELMSRLHELDFRFSVGAEGLHLDAPKGALTEGLRAELRERKAEIRAFLLESGKDAAVEAIRPVPRTGPLPLSYAQERLWYLDQLDPGHAAYNVPFGLRLSGAVDVPALERSLGAIAQRHEVLRTRFVDRRGVALQDVVDVTGWQLPVIELGDDGGEERALELARREASRPFDLSRGPLWRAALLRLDAEAGVLLLTLHHAVSDGWSIPVLLQELATLYSAFAAGRPAALPELPVQYGDFAVWQRNWLVGERVAAQLRYWRDHLADLTALYLPSDRARPAQQSYLGKIVQRVLPARLARSLEALGREEGATLFMTVLTAFQLLLGRYASQRDIVVGTPVAGRTRREIESLIGLFVNTLVIRTEIREGECFRALLRRVRACCLDAYSHQELPFERLVQELDPERDLGRSPLFQVLFAMQNGPLDEVSFAGLRAGSLEVAGETTKFDLSISMMETGRGLEALCEYSTDLFEECTVARLLESFETLLDSAVAEPDVAVERLHVVSVEQRALQLGAWDDTRQDLGRGVCLHELVEAQAARTPDAVAVVDGERCLSYGAVEARASRLADRLRQLGVGAEVPVGICLERSADLVVSVLGVLKAGGAYVPLEPEYPRERLRFMAADAGVEFVISRPALVGGWYEGTLVDPGEVKLAELAPPSCGARHCVARNMAYLIYTSGSTGVPKGVVIEHRSAVAMIDWACSAFGPEELEYVLAATSLSFDLSVFELFLPLASGACVVLAESVLELSTLPWAERLTLINSVPAVLGQLLHQERLPGSVATVNLAGEPLSAALVDELYERHGVKRVLNLYGPSETTTYSTFASIERGDRRAPGIGRPITGTRALVLDDHHQLLPAGARGELHLGGMGVARGYHGRASLTAERFVPDPFASRGERLYRTGDLCRHRNGGELEFLGRRDRQVKLRGFRIELEEVEAALVAIPGIAEAAIVARAEAFEDRELVAYFVSREPLSSLALRRSLRESLPALMIPSHFIGLEKLPRTPSGKLDRQSLPAPGRRGRPADSAPPRTELEAALAEILAEVLDVERVGIHDDFFDLGGHSLLATQVVARIRERFEVDLPLKDIFRWGTVAGLGEGIARLKAAREAVGIGLKGAASRASSPRPDS